MRPILPLIIAMVVLTPALFAQEQDERPNPWSFNYMIQWPRSEVQDIAGHPQPEANVAGEAWLAPWIHLERNLVFIDSLLFGFRIGAGYLHTAGQAWMKGQPIELRENVIALPLQLLLRAGTPKCSMYGMYLTMGLGPYVGFILDQSFNPIPGLTLPEDTHDQLSGKDEFRIGTVIDLAVTWPFSENRGLSLGYRMISDDNWFHNSDVQWVVDGWFLSVEWNRF